MCPPDDPKSPFDGLVTSEYANSLRKTLDAQAQGASAVLFVNARARADDRATRAFASTARAYWPVKPPHLERYTLTAYADLIRIPALQISPALAEQILGLELAPLLEKASQGSGRAAAESDVTIDIAASLNRTIVGDRSVIAKIEGSDPNLSPAVNNDH
jgi:hypothetical protein